MAKAQRPCFHDPVFQQRDVFAVEKDPSLRFWTLFAKVLAVVLVPVFWLIRFAGLLIPPLGRALRTLPRALRREVLRNRQRGDHRAAFDAALRAVSLQEELGAFTGDFRPLTPRRNFAPIYWWSFLDLAVEEARSLGPAERDRVVELAGRGPLGGMFAAQTLRRLAGWLWDAGEHETALSLAQRSVLADPSWAHGHVFLGWIGLISGRHDPLTHLREALRVDPSCAKQITANPSFAGAPDLLRSLGL